MIFVIPFPTCLEILPAGANSARLRVDNCDLVGNYSVSVVGKFQSFEQGDFTAETTFKIEVYEDEDVNKNAPYFDKELQDLILVAGQESEYELPPTSDKDGHAVTISALSQLDFIVFDSPMFTLTPSL